MWIKPLRRVVSQQELPRPEYMTIVKADRKQWLLTLECGHTVKRFSYDSKALPQRCQCSRCGHSDMG